MKTTPLRRALALFLAAQPALWMSDLARAQSLEDLRGPGREERSRPSPEAAMPYPALPSVAPGVTAPEPEAIARPAAIPIDEPLDPDAYLLGPGDVLELNFWGLQNFKLHTTVDLEGRAFVPRVGYFELRGRSLTESRALLRASATRSFPRLSFDVALTHPRTFLVQVVENVALPGAYPARAVDRVATLIARAGGLAANASRRRIEVSRRDGTKVPADLLLYTTTGDVRHNPFLLDGDVIRVPFEELAATIEGAVNRPGRYELTGARDLAELVALAGGFAPTATRLLPITVVRRGERDEELLVRLERQVDEGIPAHAVRHGDAVRVPSVAELQRSVFVVGAVGGAKAPNDPAAIRTLPFVEGESVRTLLERVGGVGPLANLASAHLVRGAGAVPVDLEALVARRDLSADRPVELGDTLVVPFKQRDVLVRGAVHVPGTYPYNPTFGVEQYLRLAGGPNRAGRSLDDVRIVTATGETRRYERGLPIAPGSTLILPERNFQPAEIVQLTLTAASVLVSGIAVLLAARQ